MAAARDIAAFADERRRRRAGATRRYPPDDVSTFDPHVLLELDSLRAGIAAREDVALRESLELVFSAILVKVSRRTSDTSGAAAQRRIAAGFPARLFVKKTEELAARLAAFVALLPPGTPPARVTLDDATRLRTVAAATVDAVVTSPPYVATYDYLAHHALRLRWLGLDAHPFATGEMGSRRRYATLDAASARATWSRELTSSLRSLARVCRKGARIALVIADSAVQGEALRADALVAAAAEGAGFASLARASQRRPHFHGPIWPAPSTPPPAPSTPSPSKSGRSRAPRRLPAGRRKARSPWRSTSPRGRASSTFVTKRDAPVPFSCRGASCGTCRVDVLEGASLLAPPLDEELDVLDIFGDDPARRRLCCQAVALPGPGRIRVRPAGT